MLWLVKYVTQKCRRGEPFQAMSQEPSVKRAQQHLSQVAPWAFVWLKGNRGIPASIANPITNSNLKWGHQVWRCSKFLAKIKKNPTDIYVITSTLALLAISLKGIQVSQGHWLSLTYLVPEIWLCSISWKQQLLKSF